MVNSIKCPVCGAVCDASFSTCTTCGNAISTAKQVPSGFGTYALSGFGDSQRSGFNAPQSGFGASAPIGFDTSLTATRTSGFDVPPPTARTSGFVAASASPLDFKETPTGFEKAPQLGFDTSSFNSGFGVSQQSGFGAPSIQGVGTPPEADFGAPADREDSSFDTVVAEAVYGAALADNARFVEAVNGVLSDDRPIQWSFIDCIVFMLKRLIPIYGLIVLVSCVIGNPRKFPIGITNYIRASLLIDGVLLLIVSIFAFMYGSTLLSAAVGG